MKSKTDQQKVHRTSHKRKTQTSQKEGKNRKMTEKDLPQDQKEKSEHRESTRLRSQPGKNYKTFFPQSKILKKIEFKKKLSFLFFIIFFLFILNIHIFKITC